MNPLSDWIDPARLKRAAERAVLALAAEQTAEGGWRGQLASSALATATACTALRLAEQAGVAAKTDATAIRKGLAWLVQDQNEDGGWGDAPGCRSNIATTFLVTAALQLAGPERYEPALRKGHAYVERSGGLEGLKARYGEDRTFVVPIMTMLALAGLLPWRVVPGLPFELGVLPHNVLRGLQIGVVSYALPALIAIGYCVARQQASRLRSITWPVLVPLALRRLRALQPESGGYLEAVPLTAFVCMSLMASGRATDDVVHRGLAFLRRLQRADGSWPIDADLACWVTSLTVPVLERASRAGLPLGSADLDRARDWLLGCQHLRRHPYTGAAPGGWGWTDLPGAVPDADDTPAALLALRPRADQPQVVAAAVRGIRWLLGLQNRDGGWPTFCRGWGWLPFDRSTADLTAHVLRALDAWEGSIRSGGLARRIDRAIERGLAYLVTVQREDGSFVPLWFGNEHHPDEENPLYGTARVLMALNRSRVGRPAVRRAARRAAQWLVANQNPDGGWGGERGLPSTVEETGLAVSALARCPEAPAVLGRGVEWLCRAVEDGTWQRPAPIGLYFAKLWYFERLYPMIFATQGLVDAWCALHRQRDGVVMGSGGQVEASSGCS